MPRPASDVAVRTVGLGKRYGAHVALAGLDLAIPPGEIYCLLGPNGAGKTTTVRILSTLLSPDAGSAQVAGFDVEEQPGRVRSVIGLTGQFSAVDPVLTGRENVALMGDLYHLPRPEVARRTQDILEALDLVDAADRQVRTYSGGLRRRLDLAASLVGQPGIVFLDEPTTGLDPRARLDVWDHVRTLARQGTTLLLTTQYLEEAEALAGRIGVMDRGRLVAEDTPERLKQLVGGDVLELAYRDEADANRSASLLVDSHPPVRRDGLSIVRVPTQGSPGLAQWRVAQALHGLRLQPDSVTWRAATLQDVFLILTGRSDDDPAARLPGRGEEVTVATQGRRPASPAEPVVVAPGAVGEPDQVMAPDAAIRAADDDPVPGFPSRAQQGLRDDVTMTRRHLLQWVRLPQGMAASLGQPVMFVLLFRYVFGGAITAPGFHYVDYVIPGIALQVAVFGSAGTAIGLAEDLRSGLLDRFRSLPIQRVSVLVGRIAADTVRNLLAVLLTVGLGYVVGFRFHGGPVAAGAMVALAVLAGVAFSLLSACIGLAVRGVEAVQAIVLIVLFVLTFASSVFVPARTMPLPLRVFAQHQPVSVLADAMRDLALAPGAPGTTHDVLLGLGWMAVLVVVFAPLATLAYDRKR